MSELKVGIKLLHPNAKFPQYSHPGDAGADVCAVTDFSIGPMHQRLNSNESHVVMVPLGFSMEIPEGYEVQIRPRSGLAYKQQVTVINTPGTIDAKIYI